MRGGGWCNGEVQESESGMDWWSSAETLPIPGLGKWLLFAISAWVTSKSLVLCHGESIHKSKNPMSPFQLSKIIQTLVWSFLLQIDFISFAVAVVATHHTTQLDVGNFSPSKWLIGLRESNGMERRQRGLKFVPLRLKQSKCATLSLSSFPISNLVSKGKIDTTGKSWFRSTTISVGRLRSLPLAIFSWLNEV